MRRVSNYVKHSYEAMGEWERLPRTCRRPRPRWAERLAVPLCRTSPSMFEISISTTGSVIRRFPLPGPAHVAG